MPFFDDNPVTPAKVAARLRRALAQNTRARRERNMPLDGPPTGADTATWQPDDTPRTTLDATIRPVGSGRYRRLGWAPGEPHLVRDDLGVTAAPGRTTARRSVLYFAHHTDVHITDAQAPARLVGAQGLAWIHPGMDAAHRAEETMTTQVFDQLVRATNALATSPTSGAPMAVCVQGGDHTDNRTVAEARWFTEVLTGRRVTPNTGAPGRYEGVQRSGWRTVWNPDLCGVDRLQRHGHPFLPGVLDAAVAPFDAVGLDVPCLCVAGNHDRLFTGTFGPGAGGLSLAAIEPRLRDGTRAPVTARGLVAEIVRANLPGAVRRRIDTARVADGFGSIGVTPDPEHRRPIDDTALPPGMVDVCGQGCGVGPVDPSVTWWSHPFGAHVQLVGLDTTNHADGEGGRIGPRQQAWLATELARHHSAHGGMDRLVVVVSHHNSWIMDNPVDDPFDPGPSLGGEGLVEELGRWPNVVLWVNGHSHAHRIAAHRSRHRPGGFWEVANTSVVGFGQQGRLFELFDNGDGTLSILTTVFDHAAPPRIAYPTQTAAWTPAMLASLSRELSANDDRWLDPMDLLGGVADRNAELVVAAPFPLA